MHIKITIKKERQNLMIVSLFGKFIFFMYHLLSVVISIIIKVIENKIYSECRSCKPCYVEDDNLSKVTLTFRRSVPLKDFPYQYLGFSLAGLSNVSLLGFPNYRHCGAL